MGSPAPDLVLVLGMHRSGTSLATAILQDLGVTLSEDLVEANEFNAKGYFESASVMRIHDDILNVLGASWRTPALSRPFPHEWWRSDVVAPYRRELRRLIERHKAGSGSWAVKDPRAARLLPLWNALIDELQLQAAYVLCFRDPAQVAASLQRRDEIPRALSDALWLEHNVEILRSSGGRLVYRIDYERWFRDGVDQARELLVALNLRPGGEADPATIVRRWVDAGLRHEVDHTQSAVPLVSDLYQALSRGDEAAIGGVLERYGEFREFIAAVEAAQGAEQSSGLGMRIHEMHRRVAWRENVSLEEVKPFLDSDDARERAIANIALSRTSSRTALRAMTDAAKAQNDADPQTVRAAMHLVALSDVDTPYIEMLKRIGIRSARSGNDDDQAFRLLQEALQRAFITGERPAPDARTAFDVLDDAHIWQACEAIAARIPVTDTEPPNPNSVLIVCTSLRVSSPGSSQAVERAHALRALGYDVEILVTESGVDEGNTHAAELASAGIAAWQAPGPIRAARLRTILEHCRARGSGVTLLMPSAQDLTARILSCAALPGIRVWERRLFSPRCGNFDLITDIAAADDPGAYLALPAEIDLAQPLDRSTLDIPETAVVLATVGRYAKCAQPEFVQALARALSALPQAYLVVSGVDEGGALDLLRGALAGHSLQDRMRAVDPSLWRSVLKTADVYCDTSPWNGQQSLLAAMYAGLPVVAFAAGSMEAATARFAQAVLNGIVPLAVDAPHYAELVQAYARDEQSRSRIGARLHHHVKERFDPGRAAQRLKERLDALDYQLRSNAR